MVDCIARFEQDRNCMHFSSLPHCIFKRLDSSAAATSPKTKYYLGKINHVTISNRAGGLAPGKLQLDDPIELLEPGLNPLWLLEPGVRNHAPTTFGILQ